MFNLLISVSLRNRAVRAWCRADPDRLRRGDAAQSAGRRVSGSQPAHGHARHRGRRTGTRRGRAARHVPTRDSHERHARRRARSLGLGRRPVHRLRRVRLGHGHLSSIGSRLPSGSASCASSCRATSIRRWRRSPPSWARSCSSPSPAIRQAPWRCARSCDWVMRPRLLTIPGVAQVIPIGGEVRQYRVTLNLAQMTTLDITRAEIETALSQFGSNTAGGFVDQHAREYLIRNLARTTRLEDLENLPVAYRNGVAVRLEQVAVDRLCRTRQTRRCRPHGQAGRDPYGPEAAQRRHAQADRRDRDGVGRAQACSAEEHHHRRCPVQAGHVYQRRRSTMCCACWSKRSSSWHSSCSCSSSTGARQPSR